MTIKTLIICILLAAFFLLFTACDSKVERNATDEQSPTVQVDTTTGDTGDEGTTVSGSVDNNTTTETNTTVVDTETNTTVAMVNIKSLELTVGNTSLNREENTTLKVEMIHNDNTAKDVTDQVVWIGTP